jgi:hypothetical protein
MTPEMFDFAGNVMTVSDVFSLETAGYRMCGGGSEFWSEWMFDPDYNPADRPLSAGDAIIAMVRDGETLVDEDGREHCWDGDDFVRDIGGNHWVDFYEFNNLYRRPAKRKRAMNRWEILDWASSEASRGWVVRQIWNAPDWMCPPAPFYNLDTDTYQRARLLPDLSGVDESTIQGFEVEVK